jgi:hypothetical protein
MFAITIEPTAPKFGQDVERVAAGMASHQKAAAVAVGD